jgi:two-component system, OmpR family, sensor histidine kinase KdpD
MWHMYKPSSVTLRINQLLPGLIVWTSGWYLLWVLKTHLDLANLGLILILTSSVAAIWLPLGLTIVLSILAVMAFNWMFVPPVGTFSIHFRQDALLLFAMFVVNIIIASLMSSLRHASEKSKKHADAVDALRIWSDRLRDADEPKDLLPNLCISLSEISGKSCSLGVLRDELPKINDVNAIIEYGSVNQKNLEGFWHCIRTGKPLGPGTGQYQELNDLYLPLRGRTISFGAAIFLESHFKPFDVQQAQAFCDQMGIALERRKVVELELSAREYGQAQRVRNTLLAAISHDYRTPLSIIMSAASSLEQQGEKMNALQREELAGCILDEADRLKKLTQNVLQLARLDAVGLQLKFSWESIEDIIGSVVFRFRSHKQSAQIKINIKPNLPLIWGDSLLLSQLLENLLDNALKYCYPGSFIEITSHLDNNFLHVEVQNEGPDINILKIEQLFSPFLRGDQQKIEGAGIGLALCQTITQIHSGTIDLITQSPIIKFVCKFPLKPQPALEIELE